MIDLTADQSELLRRIVQAGPEGVCLSDEFALGAMLHLGILGLVRITNKSEPPQRCIATATAAGFVRRGAFA